MHSIGSQETWCYDLPTGALKKRMRKVLPNHPQPASPAPGRGGFLDQSKGGQPPARGELQLFHSCRGPVLASCSAVAILKFAIILSRGSTFSFCIEPAHYVAGCSGEPALLPIRRHSPAAAPPESLPCGPTAPLI